MSAGVTIVTSASSVKPSRHASVKSPCGASVKSSAATMSTPLGKRRWWREAKRDRCGDYAKNDTQRKFRH